MTAPRIRVALLAAVIVAACKSALPGSVTREMAAAGETTFKNGSCFRCHGADAKGTPRGPDLTDKQWVHIDGSYDQIVHLVTTGFTKAEQRDARYPFQMNPRGGTNLTDQQIREVSAYVWTLSRQ